MKNKNKSNLPAVIIKTEWGKYTFAEILKSEQDSFVIQVGNDLFDDQGRLVFTKTAADLYHKKILENLLDILDGGDNEERKEAMEALASLRIMPLRIN